MRLLLILLCLSVVPLLHAGRSFVRSSSQSLTNAAPLVSLPFTISAWFKTDDVSVNQTIFFVGAPDAHAHYLMFRGATNDTVTATSNGIGSTNATSVGTVAANTWYHGAGVWSATNARAVYLNGAKATDGVTVTTNAATHTALGVFYVSSPSNYFSGVIAEVGLWNVALTDDEIAALAKGISPLLVRPQSLVDYWWLVSSGDALGVKGNILTNAGTTDVEDHPRTYR